MVADPSKNGLETVKRLHQLTEEMDIGYDKLVIIINRLRRNTIQEQAHEVKHLIGADLILGIPDDTVLAESAEKGESLQALDDNHPVVALLDGLLSEMGFNT